MSGRNHRQARVLAVLFACVFASPPAIGDAPGEDAAIEEIVVTGSRIKRRDFTSISPISTLDRATIENTGQVTLETALNQLPQVTPDLERTANNPGDGTARVNLRGLGSGRTLVLLNGRRVAPSGVGSAVDVNNLPQVLIERIEVITGGATTVYGSDAVAGVVNFITRKEFEGLGLDASAYTTGEGDSDIVDANLAFGLPIGGDRGNLALFAGYLDREPSFAGDRDLTSVPLIDIGGELVEGGSTTTPSGVVFGPPADLGDGPVQVTFTADGLPVAFRNPEDRYNYAPLNYLQTPLERVYGGAFFDYALGGQAEAYAEIMYTRNTASENLAPAPLGGVFATNTDNPVLTPEAQQVFADYFVPVGPDTVIYFLGRRLEEVGPRITERTNDYVRAVLGLRGDIGPRWEYDAWATYTSADEEALFVNDASFSRIQQGLLVDPASGQCFDPSGGCVPVDLFGAGRLSAEAQAFISFPPLANTTDRTQELVSAFVRGPLFEGPGGDVKVAFGAEWRQDEGSFHADPALFSGDAIGFRGTASVDGSESVFEGYAEAVVPLASDLPFVDYLGLELGARYSDYEHAGSIDTWKIGAEWQPIDTLRFRVMTQRSVRAPNLAEAFQEQYVEVFPYVGADPAEDPCSASADPVANGNVEKCIATGLPADQIGIFEAAVGIPTNFIYGGNPDLVPEEADTLTIGAVFSPVPDLTVSVDYFDLEVDDTIGQLVSTVACFDPLNTDNRFCDTFGRDPNTYDVVELFEINVNRGALATRGVDTQLDWQATLNGGGLPMLAGADVGLRLIWTRVFENTIQAVSGGSELDCIGGFGWPCTQATDGQTFPESRVTTELRYTAGDFDALLSWRWIEGTDNAEPRNAEFLGMTPAPVAIESIGSKSYLDLGLGYRFSQQLGVRLYIANLLDTDAPLMGDAVTSNNTDTRFFDIFGRSYTLSVSARYP